MTAEQAAIILLQCICPLLAQSGHGECADECPLLGVKRTLPNAIDHFQSTGLTHYDARSGR
jgi:hypothetical protein